MIFKNQKSTYLSLSCILPILLSTIMRIIYYDIYRYSHYVDTNTYMDAGKNLLNGHIDMMRTPIYPLFLEFCLSAFPNFNMSIVIIQSIIFILSIFFFHRICIHFIKNKYIVFLMCLAYGTIPSTVNWEFCLLTESFSIVSIVIFVYLITLYLDKRSSLYIVMASFFIFFMVMIKPGFIYIYVILFAFLILNFILTKNERAQMTKGIISSILSLLLIFTYIQINKYQNNVNGISIVTDINTFFNIVLADIYKDNPDKEISENIDKLISEGRDPNGASYETELTYRSYKPINRIGNFNEEALKKNKKKYNEYTILKFINVYNININAKYAGVKDKYKDYIDLLNIFDLNIKFFHVYILLLFEFILILTYWIIHKIPPWGTIGIFSIMLLQIVVSLIGAQREFSRLICPILPLIIISIFKNISLLIDSLNIKKRSITKIALRKENLNLKTDFKTDLKIDKTAIIIGAGPAGLTAAYEILKNTDIKPIIFEETNEIGGISRTINYKGNCIDIGGHRFFSKDEYVMQFWKNIMPLQGKPSKDDIILNRTKNLSYNGPDPELVDRVMLLRSRISRILYLRKFFDYPISLKAETILNLGLTRTLKAGFGYIFSSIFKRKELTLEDFMINRFGKPLYKMFFEDYNKKVWGVSPAKMSPDWGAQRIKGLSLIKALGNMLRSAIGIKNKKVETSLIEEFLYPKKGPGQLWETVALEIMRMGGEIHKNHKVIKVNNEENKISSIIVENENTSKEITGNYIISSMPIKDLFESFANKNILPSNSYEVAVNLPYRDFITVGLLTSKLKLENKTDIKTVGNIVPDCWIYIQEKDVKIGRLQIFNNWSPYMVKDYENTVWIGLEYFCNEGDDMWNMDDETFIEFAISELVKINVLDKDDVKDALRIRVKKAYPGYFGVYKEFNKVKDYLDTLENLYCIGRNGQHRYNNMDHSMVTALECIKNIKNNVKEKENIWNVNIEKEYHESKKETEEEYHEIKSLNSAPSN